MAISEKSQQIIKEFLLAWWEDLRWKARETMLGTELPIVSPDDLYQSGFGGVLRQMAAAAEGISKRSEEEIGEVHECVQQLCEWMWARPGQGGSYHIPKEFWITPTGDLAIRAYLWCSDDKLITMSEASEVSGRTLSDLSQLADRGKLDVYPDLGEPNPTKRNRVKLSEVKALPAKRKKKQQKRKRG